MNWYNVFYWITVADGVKGFFDTISNWFLAFSIIGAIAWVIAFICSTDNLTDKDDIASAKHWIKYSRRFFFWSFTLMTITWSAYVFCPSKRDAILIVAGGAVGNFITSDSSAKQIPAELTLLIRQKMKTEVENIKAGKYFDDDKLEDKSKEELIKMVKEAKE